MSEFPSNFDSWSRENQDHFYAARLREAEIAADADVRKAEIAADVRKAEIAADVRKVEIAAENEVDRLAELQLKLDRERCKSALKSYIFHENRDIPEGKLGIAVPEGVVIEDSVLRAAMTAVSSYNSSTVTSIEMTKSIKNPASVHFLWRQIIEIIEAGVAHEPFESRTRIVYELTIMNPFASSGRRRSSLDFTFIPATLRHLNWLQFRGGLELKRNPKRWASGENTASGTENTDGRRQAIARAAMCIYSRCEHTGWARLAEGAPMRAFCLFGDGRMLGVARVSVGADFAVSVDVSDLVKLPGYGDCRDATALRLFKHVVESPPEELLELMSPPPPFHTGLIEGFDEAGAATSWEMGSYLGSGGFGFVCAWGAGEPNELERTGLTVIKTCIDSIQRPRLRAELTALRALEEIASTSPLDRLPRCVAALSDAAGGSTIVALRLGTRGVSVPQFLRSCGDIRAPPALLTQLVQLLGPSVARTLRDVHGCGIFHRDVRLPTLLIVPPAETMSRIANCLGSVLSEPKEISAIDLGASSFLLNDWGEAQIESGGSGNRQQLAAADLRALVVAAASPARQSMLSDVSGYSASPVAPPVDAPVLFGPTLAADVVAELMLLADAGDYDGLACRLADVSFPD